MLIGRKKKSEESVEIQEKENRTTVEKDENKHIQSREKHGSTEDNVLEVANNDKELNLFILCDNATNKFKKYIQETEVGARQVFWDSST